MHLNLFECETAEEFDTLFNLLQEYSFLKTPEDKKSFLEEEVLEWFEEEGELEEFAKQAERFKNDLIFPEVLTINPGCHLSYASFSLLLDKKTNIGMIVEENPSYNQLLTANFEVTDRKIIFDKIQKAYKDLELSLCVNKDDIFNNKYIDEEYALSLK